MAQTSKRLSDDEMKVIAVVAALKYPLGQVIRHTKTGNEYIITGHHFREYDMEICVQYAPGGGNRRIAFSRPVAEITERFEKVSA